MAKSKIESKLDDVVDSIKTLTTAFRKVNYDWQGKDYDDNLNNIETYQKDIASKVEQLKNDFVKYMNESSAAYDKTRKDIRI